MLNKYLAIGNLTQNPESKTFSSGNSVCNFSVAINDGPKSVTFMDIQAWNKNGEKCQKFLKKGSRVFIEGRLKTNQWTSKTGEKRQKLFCSADVVTFLNGNTETETNNSNVQQENKSTELPEGISQEDFDQIPF